jgi:hypothetical protein
MLPCSAGEITRDPSVQRAIRPVGHDLDPGISHYVSLRKSRTGGNDFVDGRHKAGHDKKSTLGRV